MNYKSLKPIQWCLLVSHAILAIYFYNMVMNYKPCPNNYKPCPDKYIECRRDLINQ